MSIEWCRLWHDMPTDPKFRAIAKRAGRPTSEVLALFTAMLANASANDDDRGTLRNWSHEDMAIALDIEPAHAEAIYTAMQGKLLEGERLTGWERRQPKREDSSAERVRAMRERKRAETPCNAPVTQRNAQEKEKDTDKEEEVVQSRASAPAAALPDRFMERMVEAAGESLANPVNAQGLLTEATPMMWLESGCDFDRDVLPTLRAAAVSRKGKRISTWGYFTGMIGEARARRLAGMPVASISRPTASAAYTPAPRRRELSDEEKDRIAREYA